MYYGSPILSITILDWLVFSFLQACIYLERTFMLISTTPELVLYY